MTDGPITLDEARRREAEANNSPGPGPMTDAPPPASEDAYGAFDAVAEVTALVEIAPVQMNGEDDAAPLGDPFHKLPAPPLPRGLLPPILEAFAEREARIKGVEFVAPAMAALTVCAAAIPDHVSLRVKVHEAWKESARL